MCCEGGALNRRGRSGHHVVGIVVHQSGEAGRPPCAGKVMRQSGKAGRPPCVGRVVRLSGEASQATMCWGGGGVAQVR